MRKSKCHCPNTLLSTAKTLRENTRGFKTNVAQKDCSEKVCELVQAEKL